MEKQASIPTEIIEEIDRYEEMVKKFRAGEVGPDAFQRYRLQHGIYGQRQDGVQMVRIKIPLGMLTSEQIECIADLAETIAHNNAHLTTRQDIQIHYVKLENTPEMMRKFAKVGLTTREACGNTVRNVTASPSAGVDPEELFDVTPYAHAFAYHLLRNPINQNLPRKFKVPFDGGGRITALPLLHDFAFVAAIRLANGQGEKGFKVYVGGGLGSSPRVAKLLHEFLPPEEMIPWAHAVLQVFDRYGERKIRSKARIKFLVEKLGFEKFKELVTEERKGIEVDPAWNDFLKHLGDWEENPPVVNESDIPRVGAQFNSPEYETWKKSNVIPQKQKGYSMAEIRLTTGDMSPKQMRPFAQILRRYAGGKCRTIVHQNLLIRWVRNQDLPSLYEELRKIGFVKKDAQTVYDITACPGTDTCRLGIASSMGLARVLEKRLYEEGEKIAQVAREVSIKLSGCPNSCGQHHIANIGFYGGAIPVNGHTAPAFQLMLGAGPVREMVLPLPIEQVPSKNVPDAVVRLIRHFAENRRNGEKFFDFYQKIGKEGVIKLLSAAPDLMKVPTYEEKPEFYTDWEDQQEFALQKGVIGECAGQMKADIPPSVKDGDASLEMAKALLDHKKFEAAAIKAYEAMVKAANGLLYMRLVSTFNDIETTHEVENQFVKTGLLPQWKNFHKEIQDFRKKAVDEAVATEWLKKATEFIKSLKEKEAEVKNASPQRPAGPQPDTLAI